jgi:hypothetical protein
MAAAMMPTAEMVAVTTAMMTTAMMTAAATAAMTATVAAAMTTASSCDCKVRDRQRRCEDNGGNSQGDF